MRWKGEKNSSMKSAANNRSEDKSYVRKEKKMLYKVYDFLYGFLRKWQ